MHHIASIGMFIYTQMLLYTQIYAYIGVFWLYLVLSYIITIQCKLTEAKMLKPYLIIANLQDKTPQHLLNTVVVVLGLAIRLGIIAGTKEAFGSHMRPKGLPKCTLKLEDLGHIPPTKAHNSF